MSRIYRKSSRRQFLRDLGLGAAGAALIPLMEAHADVSGGFPKRLVLFFTPHGFAPGTWEPSAVGPTYTLGKTLLPLASMQKKIVVTQGLYLPNPVAYEGHLSGSHKIWTGTEVNPGPSIDQAIATSIGRQTLFPSLQLGIANIQNYAPAINFSSPNVRMVAEFDARNAFNTIFSTSPLKQVQSRLSAADLLLSELKTIRSRVSTADKFKIDAHLNAVNELETRLKARLNSPACTAGPTLQASPPLSGGSPNTPVFFDNQIDNLVGALTCDLTRVATICTHGVPDDESYPFLALPLTNSHHGLTHQDATAVAAQLAGLKLFFAQKFASLLAKLDAVPEGAGTLLDNTLVVWGTEYADANAHSGVNMPFILAGSAGGAMKTGFSVKFDDRLSHHRLLVTIGQAFGLTSLNRFGADDPGSGSLSPLLAS